MRQMREAIIKEQHTKNSMLPKNYQSNGGWFDCCSANLAKRLAALVASRRAISSGDFFLPVLATRAASSDCDLNHIVAKRGAISFKKQTAQYPSQAPFELIK